MNDVFDQLIEHALREELGACPPARDLAAAVALALSEGVAVPVPEPVRVPMRRRRMATRAIVFASAAIVLAAAATVVAVLSTRTDGALAHADRALQVAAVDGTFAPRTALAPGAVAWCTGDRAAQLAFTGGSDGSAMPGSVFAIRRHEHGADVELLAGAFELRAEQSSRLRCAFADVSLAAGTAVRCELTPSAPTTLDPRDRLMNLDHLRTRLSATLFTVTVLAGTADLAIGQHKEPVAAGQTRRATAPQPDVAARATKLFEAVRKNLASPTDEASMLAWKDMEEKKQELAKLLLGQPEAMAALRRPILGDVQDGRLAAQTRGRLIGLALLDEENAALRVVGGQWQGAPDLFGFEEQVALAERGFAPAAAKLREFLKEPSGPNTVRAAAALALAGDREVFQHLRQSTAVTMEMALEDFMKFDARCQASVAFAAHGRGGMVASLRSDVRGLVEGLLAKNDPQQTAQAALFLQRALYYLDSDKPRLSWLNLRMAANQADVGDGVDAAKVRAMLPQLSAK